jgi:hypothetical protein
MGFSYEKCKNRRSVLIGRQDVLARRTTLLRIGVNIELDILHLDSHPLHSKHALAAWYISWCNGK